jgi:hypothetical protein
MSASDETPDRKGAVSGRRVALLVIVGFVFLGTVFYLLAASLRS